MGCSQSAFAPLSLSLSLCFSVSAGLVRRDDRPGRRLFINEWSRETHPLANQHPFVYYSTGSRTVPDYVLSAGKARSFFASGTRGLTRSKRPLRREDASSNLNANDHDQTGDCVNAISLESRERKRERERENTVKMDEATAELKSCPCTYIDLERD